jgi:hypothetical protein
VEVGQAVEQQETAVERHVSLRAASRALVVVVVGGGGGYKEGGVLWECGCGQQVTSSWELIWAACILGLGHGSSREEKSKQPGHLRPI